MPSPTSALESQRPDLRESFREFDLEANMQGFIGLQVFPTSDVMKQAGNFGKIPVEQLLMKRNTLRAPGAGYSRQTWEFEPASYATEEHGAEEPVDDREAEMYSDYFVAEQVSAARALSAIMVNHEQRIADAVFNTTVWTGAALTTAVGVTWATHATATPITDVIAAATAVRDGSGLEPNTLIVSRNTWKNLIQCDQIIERVKYQGFMDARPGAITREAAAQALDIDRVLVGTAVKNDANPGVAADIQSIWGDTLAMVCKVVTTQDFREPGIGRTFHWSADGSQVQGLLESYRDPTIRGDVIRARHDVDEVTLHVESGHLLSNIS